MLLALGATLHFGPLLVAVVSPTLPVLEGQIKANPKLKAASERQLKPQAPGATPAKGGMMAQLARAMDSRRLNIEESGGSSDSEEDWGSASDDDAGD